MPVPHSCMRDEPAGVPRKIPNPEFTEKKITIAGYTARSLNLSAKSCKMKTFTIDCFADMDLRRLADKFILVNLDNFKDTNGRLIKPSAYYLFDAIQENKEEILSNDYFLIGSAFENYPDLLKIIEKYPNYVGSSTESVEKVRSTENLYPYLIKNKINFPKTLSFSFDLKMNKERINNEEKIEQNKTIIYHIYDSKIKESAENVQISFSFNNIKDFFTNVIEENFNFPFVLKSEKSGGGLGVFLIHNFNEFIINLEDLKQIRDGKILVQEYVKGKHMSCSFLSNGDSGKLIFLSEQIIGEKRFGCQNDFAYCGNILSKALSSPDENQNKELVKYLNNLVSNIVKYSRLVGSNGLDFILTQSGDNFKKQDLFFMEINARFQGTLDLFEAATGLNMIEMHIKSVIDKELPEKIDFPTDLTYIRAIYYSPIDFFVMVDLQGLDFKDIPLIGNQILFGQPLCSTITSGCDKKEAFKKVLEDRDLIVKVLALKSRIPEDSFFLKI